MATYHISPIGEFVHPWFNKADTKYNSDGLFHCHFHLPEEDAEELKKTVEGAAMAALAEHTDEMKPAMAKKWSVYTPFEDVEDDDGNPTGVVDFTFKQNAKIKTKKGEIRDITIELRDSQDNIIDKPIFGGSKGRILFSMRPIVMATEKKAGVRLDFYKVQITELAKGRGGKGFGAVEGGYVADHGDEPEGADEDDQGAEY